MVMDMTVLLVVNMSIPLPAIRGLSRGFSLCPHILPSRSEPNLEGGTPMWAILVQCDVSFV